MTRKTLKKIILGGIVGLAVFSGVCLFRQTTYEKIDSRLNQIAGLVQDESRFPRGQLLSKAPLSEAYSISLDAEDYYFGAVFLKGQLDNVNYWGLHFNDEIPKNPDKDKLQHIMRAYEEEILDFKHTRGVDVYSDNRRGGRNTLTLEYKDNPEKLEKLDERWLEILNRVYKDMKKVKTVQEQLEMMKKIEAE